MWWTRTPSWQHLPQTRHITQLGGLHFNISHNACPNIKDQICGEGKKYERHPEPNIVIFMAKDEKRNQQHQQIIAQQNEKDFCRAKQKTTKRLYPQGRRENQR